MSKTIKLSEVQKHNTDESCWFVINDKVYNVSDFFDEHPGGKDFLMKYAGDDATFEFYDVGHSPGATELLPDYEVGVLDSGDLEILKKKREELKEAQELKKSEAGGGCAIL